MTDLRTQLSRMLVFTRVVQHASFAAAARSLGLSRSLVSETVSELEDSVGVRLLERTTRKLRLTQCGQAFFARCELVTQEAEAALAEATSTSVGTGGVLRVTSTSVLIESIVGPTLAELFISSGIRSELTVDDQRRDIIAEGFDAGVRIGVPSDSQLIARFVGTTTDVIVAAPALVGSLDPDDLEGVRRLPWIVHCALPSRVNLVDPGGHERVLHLDPSLTVNTTVAQRTLLLAGAGASVAIRTLVAEDIAAGRLVCLLARHRLPALQLFILMPSKHVPVRTRLFIEAFLARARTLL